MTTPIFGRSDAVSKGGFARIIQGLAFEICINEPTPVKTNVILSIIIDKQFMHKRSAYKCKAR